MFVIITLLLCICALTFLYLTGRYNERYWNKRGVVFHTKNKALGPMWEFITKDRALFEVFHDIYKQYPNEPAVGVGSFLTPALYVKDPVNLQHVLQSDFLSFNHRSVEVNEGDILADNVLFMNGNRWKLMRQNMTPLFTSTKLKSMYYIIEKSAVDFVDYLNKHPEKLKGDAFGTLDSFCSAAVGGAVFGITTESTFDSPFLKMAKAAGKPTIKQALKFAIANTSLPLFKALKIKLFGNYEYFFIGAVKQIIRQREKENVKKHDFADLCVSLQRKGKLKDSDTGFEMEPTDEILAAQAFFYFIAGVEPCALVMFNTLAELGKYPEILQKVHDEIDTVSAKHGGKLSYDAVAEMEYLDMVLSEGMRMYPPIGFLARKCIKDTVLPVGNIKVDAGTKIFTAIYAIHHDPAYYPNPHVFDPERFANDSKLSDITYQPFGKGGRICIGMRYSRLQVKTGLVSLLRNYSIKTIFDKGGNKYVKHQIQVRLANVDIEFVPRKIKSS